MTYAVARRMRSSDATEGVTPPVSTRTTSRAAALTAACLALALSGRAWVALAALLVLGTQYGALSVLTPLATSTAVPAERTTPEAPAPETTPSLMASSRTMAIASLVSRITGFLRNSVIAAAVGSGLHSVGDAYGLANTLPNMVYELLLGGVLTSVIIPVLVKAQTDDADHGEAYTQRLLSIATAGLAGATLLAIELPQVRE